MTDVVIGGALVGAATSPRLWVSDSDRVFSVPGRQLMSQVRNNERAQFEAPLWIALLWKRLTAFPLQRIDGPVASGLPGQRFKMHKDGPWIEGGMTSRLTLRVALHP